MVYRSKGQYQGRKEKREPLKWNQMVSVMGGLGGWVGGVGVVWCGVMCMQGVCVVWCGVVWVVWCGVV